MKININSSEARQKLIYRLQCIEEKVGELELEIDALIDKREECCYVPIHGITVDGSYLTNDDEILTVDTDIP